MKVGVQLWGVLKDRKDGAMEALKQLKEMGYSRLEPCVSPDVIPGLEHVIWPADRLEASMEAIAAMGLEVLSCHLAAENPAARPDILERLTRRGIRRIVVKSPRKLTDESLQQAALTYMRAAEILAPLGGELLLHNEAEDIRTRIGGKTAYEHLLDLCLGKVGAQVDVGWVYAGGEDPEALLWRNAGRVKSVHFKDFVLTGSGPEETACGKGAVDMTACLQFARAFGCDQIVDMDDAQNGLWQDLDTSLQLLNRLSAVRENTVSYLNTLDTETGEVHVIRRFDGVAEAPNWLKDSGKILYNADGLIRCCDPETGEISPVDTGFCTQCNNDHVVAPDETAIAVSHMTFDSGFTSRVYIVPFGGGGPRLVTPNSPSFLHGWSPDGEELAYCAFREHDGRQEVDVYTIPAAGGEEKRLTAGGFNDGPEYSPDGQYIWFNSTRTGLMQVWRMKRDGSEQTQMTFSDRNNWFGHVSPDGKKVLWLSYGKDDLEAREHLPNMQVELWLMNSDGSNPRKLLSLFGGQGSVNVNSWAKDSRHVAFVSYELKHR